MTGPNSGKSLGVTTQFVECDLDTLEAPVFAQHCHGLEEGWSGGAPRSGYPQQAEEIPRFESELGGERTKREFERWGIEWQVLKPP